MEITKPQEPSRQQRETSEERIHRIKAKLGSVRMPQVSFENTSIREVLNWMKKEIDAASKPDERSIELVASATGVTPVQDQTISLALSDVTAQEVLDAIAKTADAKILHLPVGVYLRKESARD